MAIERAVDFLKRLSPAERERRAAKFLADKFEKIKPHLEELEVVSIDLSRSRPLTDKDFFIVELRFDSSKENEVRDELSNAEIEEIYQPEKMLNMFMALGIAFASGLPKDHINTLKNTRFIRIYEGENIDEYDFKRLVSLGARGEPVISSLAFKH